ncbi:MAG: 16S rRNA (adenine(1518)-N(6)/adenine(1519)-N(6))-dimethyltransferase RsmA [Planctomycetota bacterium]
MSGSLDASRPERPPWASFKTALDAAGFRPSRRFGQNFLLDDNMARAIAADAGVESGRFVLEVGPGCGFLSVHLAHAGARLVCIEIDPRLAPIAAGFLAPYPDAEVIVADVLGSKSQLADVVLERLPESGPWTVAANLPYSISGPFLAALARLPHPPSRVACLAQKEVAERLAAAPGSKAWGPLTAAFGETYETSLGRIVPPQLFWPRPKVDSAVFVAEVRAELAPASLRAGRIDFYRALLGRRRQTVRRVLKDLAGAERAEAALIAANVDPGARADTLSMDLLRGLHASLGAGPGAVELDGPEAPGA